MLVYAILIAFITIVGLLLVRTGQKKRNIIFMVIAFLALTFVAACRARTVGADTINYCNYYIKMSEVDHWPPFVLFSDGGFEYGFKCFAYILYQINQDPQFLIIVTSVIINAAFCIFIYLNSKNPLLSIIIYICFLVFFENMNTMRESLAISIFLLAFPLLKKKKWWSLALFGVCVCLAGMFHTSAFFLLVLIPFVFFRISIPTVVVFLILLIPFYINAIPLYEWFCELIGKTPYMEERFLKNGEYMHAIISMCIVIFGIVMLVINSDKKHLYSNFKLPYPKKRYEETSLYLYAFFAYFTFTLLASQHTIYSRLADLFAPFIIVGVPYFLGKMPPKKRIVYSSCIGLVFIAYFVAVFVFRPTYENAWVYTFFWQV